MSIPIIIRSVPERAEFLAYLRRHLPNAVVCMDSTRDATDTLCAAFALAGDGPAIHMEDDVLLTQGFVGKVEAVVGGHANFVVQFFSMRSADLLVGSRWDRNFLAALCFYLPPGYSRAIGESRRVWPREGEAGQPADLLVADWLKARSERYWIHIPNLVEHRIAKSVIDPRRSSKRQSKTFVSLLP